MVRRVALYTRGSTSDQSCECQIAELTVYTERTNFKIVVTAKETTSGTKNDPAERKRVLDLARKGLSDKVLVIALSRWGWSTNDFRTTNEDLVSRQVPVRALKGPDIDILTAQGRLMLDSLSAISEFGRDLLQERIKSGIAHASSRGANGGRAMGRPIFNLSKRVQRLLDTGKSIRAIAAELGRSPITVMKVKTNERSAYSNL